MKSTNASRVAKSRTALLTRGGRRMPDGYLQPTVAAALETLLAYGYAPTPLAVISRALLDASEKVSVQGDR